MESIYAEKALVSQIPCTQRTPPFTSPKVQDATLANAVRTVTLVVVVADCWFIEPMGQWEPTVRYLQLCRCAHTLCQPPCPPSVQTTCNSS
jgi:hypothetical protein